jgi:hypothetical protein
MIHAGHWLFVTSLCVPILLAGCSSREADVYACPDTADTIIKAKTNRCECQPDAGTHFVNASQTCDSCDSKNSMGRFCICDPQNILSSQSAKCETCPGPDSCQSITCTPEGCDNVCNKNRCPTGQFCSASGQCTQCEPGSCGGACGNCAFGETCVAGRCVAVTKCCVGDTHLCSSAPDWCLWRGSWPEGLQCYCVFSSTDPNMFISFEPDPTEPFPPPPGPFVCQEQTTGTFCRF